MHPSSSPRRLALRIIKGTLIAAAAALYVFPPPSSWIEHHYSTGLYPRLQSAITPVSNLLPFPLSDVLILALVVGLPLWWIVKLRRAGKGARARTLAILALNTVVLASIAFLLFQFLWGLNYLRQPLLQKLDYDPKRITQQSVTELAALSTNRLNAESPEAHSSAWPHDSELANRLKPAFDAVVMELGSPRGIVPARAKVSLCNLYLESAGIDGFTDPYGLDVVLNKGLLAIEKPFALAHEWGHIAGFADESEANFIAMLTCLRSDDAAIRYAGWLDLYPQLPHRDATRSNSAPPPSTPSGSGAGPQPSTSSGRGAPPQPSTPGGSGAGPQPSAWSGSDGVASEPQLAPEVVADLRGIAERRQRRISPWLSEAQWRFYDRFLKANRVQAGVASYGLFIRLLLGTRFELGWVPARAPEQ